MLCSISFICSKAATISMGFSLLARSASGIDLKEVQAGQFFYTALRDDLKELLHTIPLNPTPSEVRQYVFRVERTLQEKAVGKGGATKRTRPRKHVSPSD